MRIVLDTNVLISATLWDNSLSHKLLIKLIEKNIEIFTRLEIIEEYKKVPLRDFKYKIEEAESIIQHLISFLGIVNPISWLEVIKEDPSDNKILECAIASSSTFILSYDNHLLKLKEFGEIKILTSNDFIKLI